LPTKRRVPMNCVLEIPVLLRGGRSPSPVAELLPHFESWRPTAAIWMVSPCVIAPLRAADSRTAKAPNPRKSILSPLARPGKGIQQQSIVAQPEAAQCLRCHQVHHIDFFIVARSPCLWRQSQGRKAPLYHSYQIPKICSYGSWSKCRCVCRLRMAQRAQRI